MSLNAKNVIQTSFSNLAELSKEEKRDIWMHRNRVTQSILAKVAGVSKCTISYFLRQPTMPSIRHAALIAFGVPCELLPEPLDRKTGPKTRTLDGFEMKITNTENETEK
jgi:transcriptional regulator with XRE-family HTH domain